MPSRAARSDEKMHTPPKPHRVKGRKRRWLLFCLCGIRSKLVIVMLFLGIGAVIGTGLYSYWTARNSLQDGENVSLQIVKWSKQQEVELFIRDIQQSVRLEAKAGRVVQACLSLTKAFADLDTATKEKPNLLENVKQSVSGFYNHVFIEKMLEVNPDMPELTAAELMPTGGAALVLQQAYLLREYVPEKKIPFNYSAYDSIHDAVHENVAKPYQSKYSFEDVMIVSVDGDVLYSYAKRIDFGANIVNGSLSKNLGYVDYTGESVSGATAAFKQVVNGTVKTYTRDYSLYLPAYKSPQAFFSATIEDNEGKPIGVLIAASPIGKINDIVISNREWFQQGLGVTGEAYLMSVKDRRMRSDSRFVNFTDNASVESYNRTLLRLGQREIDVKNIISHNTTILYQEIMDLNVSSLGGPSSTRTTMDYRGVEVLSTETLLNLTDLEWALVCKKDTSETFQGVKQLNENLLIIAFMTSAAVTFAAIVLSTWFSLPLFQVQEGMEFFGRGILSHRITVTTKDELQRLAETANQMAADLQATTVSKTYVDNILSSMSEALLVVSPCPIEGTNSVFDFNKCKIVKANAAAANLFSVPAQDLINTSLLPLFPALVRRQQKWRNIEIEAVNKEGKEIPVLLSMSTVADRDELVCVAKDMSVFYELERKHALVRDAFGRYIPKDVAQLLLDNPDRLQLGGELRHVTILMSSLLGFTNAMSQENPEKVIRFLNFYLETMVDIIIDHAGVVDEIIGENILVIFGAPVSAEDDAKRAVACAVKMQLALEQIYLYCQTNRLPELGMAIGIHSGEVVAGNIGSTKRTKYGVVGSTVNLTGRIKSFITESKIMISEHTLAEAGGNDVIATSGTAEITPKGVQGVLKLYEVSGIVKPVIIKLHTST